jgi:hypothetical protein
VREGGGEMLAGGMRARCFAGFRQAGNARWAGRCYFLLHSYKPKRMLPPSRAAHLRSVYRHVHVVLAVTLTALWTRGGEKRRCDAGRGGGRAPMACAQLCSSSSCSRGPLGCRGCPARHAGPCGSPGEGVRHKRQPPAPQPQGCQRIRPTSPNTPPAARRTHRGRPSSAHTRSPG